MAVGAGEYKDKAQTPMQAALGLCHLKPVKAWATASRLVRSSQMALTRIGNPLVEQLGKRFPDAGMFNLIHATS
jgi:hypothetical protein